MCLFVYLCVCVEGCLMVFGTAVIRPVVALWVITALTGHYIRIEFIAKKNETVTRISLHFRRSIQGNPWTQTPLPSVTYTI